MNEPFYVWLWTPRGEPRKILVVESEDEALADWVFAVDPAFLAEKGRSSIHRAYCGNTFEEMRAKLLARLRKAVQDIDALCAELVASGKFPNVPETGWLKEQLVKVENYPNPEE
jgi:hypothetical protein